MRKVTRKSAKYIGRIPATGGTEIPRFGGARRKASTSIPEDHIARSNTNLGIAIKTLNFESWEFFTWQKKTSFLRKASVILKTK